MARTHMTDYVEKKTLGVLIPVNAHLSLVPLHNGPNLQHQFPFKPGGSLPPSCCLFSSISPAGHVKTGNQ